MDVAAPFADLPIRGGPVASLPIGASAANSVMSDRLDHPVK